MLFLPKPYNRCSWITCCESCNFEPPQRIKLETQQIEKTTGSLLYRPAGLFQCSTKHFKLLYYISDLWKSGGYKGVHFNLSNNSISKYVTYHSFPIFSGSFTFLTFIWCLTREWENIHLSVIGWSQTKDTSQECRPARTIFIMVMVEKEMSKSA